MQAVPYNMVKKVNQISSEKLINIAGLFKQSTG